MVNLGTESGKVIIKVARRTRAGHAQSKHSPIAWGLCGTTVSVFSSKAKDRVHADGMYRCFFEGHLFGCECR